MALRYLLDENVRGLLWRAILRHNAGTTVPIETAKEDFRSRLKLYQEEKPYRETGS
jgi:hypothetical protein